MPRPHRANELDRWMNGAFKGGSALWAQHDYRQATFKELAHARHHTSGFRRAHCRSGRDRARDRGCPRPGRDPGAGHARAAGRNDPGGAGSDLPLGAGLLDVERSLGLGQRPLHRRRRRSGHARGDRRNAAAVAWSRAGSGFAATTSGSAADGCGAGGTGFAEALAGRRRRPACASQAHRPSERPSIRRIAERRAARRPPVATPVVARQAVPERVVAQRAPARRLAPRQFAFRPLLGDGLLHARAFVRARFLIAEEGVPLLLGAKERVSVDMALDACDPRRRIGIAKNARAAAHI